MYFDDIDEATPATDARGSEALPFLSGQFAPWNHHEHDQAVLTKRRHLATLAAGKQIAQARLALYENAAPPERVLQADAILACIYSKGPTAKRKRETTDLATGHGTSWATEYAALVDPRGRLARAFTAAETLEARVRRPFATFRSAAELDDPHLPTLRVRIALEVERRGWPTVLARLYEGGSCERDDEAIWPLLSTSQADELLRYIEQHVHLLRCLMPGAKSSATPFDIIPLDDDRERVAAKRTRI